MQWWYVAYLSATECCFVKGCIPNCILHIHISPCLYIKNENISNRKVKIGLPVQNLGVYTDLKQLLYNLFVAKV